MNVTREPTGTVMREGLTPADVMVMVVVATGGVVPGSVGVVGLPPLLLPPPPHATEHVTSVAKNAYRVVIRSFLE
jgi:hypothetical protein